MAIKKSGGEHCKVTIVAGGPTPEYTSSIESAIGILSHRDSLRTHFQLVPCVITKSGLWLDKSTSERALAAYKAGGPDGLQRLEDVASSGKPVPPWLVVSSSSAVFATIGGALGEDGVILGLCHALQTPFVGCDILASVICLDKAACKSVLEAANLPTVPYVTLLPSDNPHSLWDSSPFPLPWIIKPADGGCSIGVSRVNSPAELSNALDVTRQDYPNSTILVEAELQRMLEVDVAVMEDVSATGNKKLIVSPCGLRQNFRLDTGSSASSSSASSNSTFPSGTSSSSASSSSIGKHTWAVPAPGLPEDVATRIQALARRAFRAVRATGFMRVDFFYVESTGEILINEINTIPNMRRDSMWFKLWAGVGIGSDEWVRRVVEAALRNSENKQRNIPLSKI